jgi:hypothetical protein
MPEDGGRFDSENGVQRRSFLKGAATVAWAAPVILTLGAGTAAAASPLPAGPCSAGADCLSGCCCKTTGNLTGLCSPVAGNCATVLTGSSCA